MESKQTPLISVIVCTYNRASLLSGALQSLCSQNLDSSQYEIIVVDNNSSDDTNKIVEGFVENHANIRYCFEPAQGLSNARNCGWRVAKGRYVAYTDDDCMIPKEWLSVAKGIIDESAPAVFGGPYYPFYNSEKPPWFKDSYASNFNGDERKILGQREFISGGNIFIRRSLLEALGGFDRHLGMSGNTIAYGEETALQYKIRELHSDEAIFYEPRLYVYHLVGKNKMSLRHMFKQRFNAGRYSYQVHHGKHHRLRGEGSKSSTAFKRILDVIFEPILILSACDRDKYPHIQNYIYERLLRHSQTAGMVYEKCRHIAGIKRT